MTEWLLEQIRTIENLCKIATLLIACNRQELLPTVLELILFEAQEIVDQNCVEANKDE